MTTPRERYLAAWRLRWARRLLGISGPDLRNRRAEIHGATVTVWGAPNPHDVSDIITYTKDRP